MHTAHVHGPPLLLVEEEEEEEEGEEEEKTDDIAWAAVAAAAAASDPTFLITLVPAFAAPAALLPMREATFDGTALHKHTCMRACMVYVLNIPRKQERRDDMRHGR